MPMPFLKPVVWVWQKLNDPEQSFKRAQVLFLPGHLGGALFHPVHMDNSYAEGKSAFTPETLF